LPRLPSTVRHPWLINAALAAAHYHRAWQRICGLGSLQKVCAQGLLQYECAGWRLLVGPTRREKVWSTDRRRITPKILNESSHQLSQSHAFLLTYVVILLFFIRMPCPAIPHRVSPLTLWVPISGTRLSLSRHTTLQQTIAESQPTSTVPIALYSISYFLILTPSLYAPSILDHRR
jgi:hypothetical protein